MVSIALSHLRAAYPQLGEFFDNIGDIPMPEPTTGYVADDVVRIVTGQMLSRMAAVTIHGRIVRSSISMGIPTWRLPPDTLSSSGLSGRKVRAIVAFGDAYDRNPEAIEAWRQMRYPELRKAVAAHWGLSDWTAAMLAIFHFGHEDVFPMADGTIIRGVGLLEEKFLGSGRFDHSLTAPYGTKMAMTIWRSIDVGYWSQR